MDYLSARRAKESALLALVGLMAVIANLPATTLQSFGLEPHLLVTLLGVMVFFALFLYLRFFFFLLYTLLAVGANLPNQWAEALGISKLPLLIALAAMIGLSLLNYLVKLMPSGIEPRQTKKKSPEGIKALLTAIERNNLPNARQLLEMGFDPNELGAEGLSPLMSAAMHGNRDLVELLLHHGANINQVGKDGLTGLELALQHGHEAIATLLKEARAKTATPQPPTTTIMDG